MLSFLMKIAWVVAKFAITAAWYVYICIGMLSKLMSKPFGFALKKIKGFFARKLPVPETLNRKFSAFNGFAPFLLFSGALVFAVVAFWISSRNWSAHDNYLTYMVFNTTVGSFFGFFSDGIDFTPATLVAIAFSGALLPLCMSTHNREDKKAPVYIRVPCYSVYLVAGSILAVLLTGVFQAVGQWGYQTIMDLYHQKNGGFFLTVGKILALIPLGYMALLLLLIAIKTYAECFLFGLLGAIGLIVLALLVELVPDTYQVLKNILEVIILLGMFFGLDVLQSKALDKLDRWIEEAKSEAQLETVSM